MFLTTWPRLSQGKVANLQFNQVGLILNSLVVTVQWLTSLNHWQCRIFLPAPWRWKKGEWLLDSDINQNFYLFRNSSKAPTQKTNFSPDSRNFVISEIDFTTYKKNVFTFISSFKDNGRVSNRKKYRSGSGYATADFIFRS